MSVHAYAYVCVGDVFWTCSECFFGHVWDVFWPYLEYFVDILWGEYLANLLKVTENTKNGKNKNSKKNLR